MARYEAKLDIGGEFEASFSLPLFTGDAGNSVSLEFYNRGKAYDMSGAMIYARRGDGTVLATSGVTEGNKAEFTLYNNMYAYPGELQVQVSVVDVYGNFLTSGVLYFTVQEGFSEKSEGEGSNDFCELTSLIRQVGEGLGHIERAEQAANRLEDAFVNMLIDDTLDETSENPVQNKVIANIIKELQQEVDQNNLSIASAFDRIGYTDEDLDFGSFDTVVEALNALHSLHNEQIGDISTALTEIEALQNSYIGGGSE